MQLYDQKDYSPQHAYIPPHIRHKIWHMQKLLHWEYQRQMLKAWSAFVATQRIFNFYCSVKQTNLVTAWLHVRFISDFYVVCVHAHIRKSNEIILVTSSCMSLCLAMHVIIGTWSHMGKLSFTFQLVHTYWSRTFVCALDALNNSAISDYIVLDYRFRCCELETSSKEGV